MQSISESTSTAERSETDSHRLPGGRRQSRVNRYSVFCVIDAADRILEKGRIDHGTPQLFVELVKRHPGCRVVSETTMNWAERSQSRVLSHFGSGHGVESLECWRQAADWKAETRRRVRKGHALPSAADCPPNLREGFSFFERSEKFYSEFFGHRHWRKRWNQNRNSVCQQAAGIRLLERRSGGMRFAATANKRRIFVIMARESSQDW